MPDSQNDNPNSQPVLKNIKDKANTYEDEINLIGYFRVVWKWKYFIVLGSVLPALLVYLILFFSPKDYKMTYIYDIGLDEKSFKTLLEYFYSTENLDKIISKLKENDFDEYARIISTSNASVLQLEVLPLSFEALNTSQTATVRNLERIQQLTGTLLVMTIKAKPQRDIQKISLIIRDDFEKVIPIYSVRQKLNETIIGRKAKMADIEENRFRLELELERKKAILTKLKKLEPADSNKIPGGIILNFNNVSENSEYLPLAYQVQATETNIINIEETIKANQEKYNYYKDLLTLNESLFDEIKSKVSSYYTIQEFHSFLTNMIVDYEDKKSTDYLNAYIKKIENAISANPPILEKPRAFLIPKDNVRKTVIVFALLLMITTFGAFLLEGIQKS